MTSKAEESLNHAQGMWDWAEQNHEKLDAEQQRDLAIAVQTEALLSIAHSLVGK